MADRFNDLRNPTNQDGAEVSEQKVESVSEQEMENAPEIPLSSSERELRKANRLSVVLLLMVFVMICLFFFLFFTDRLILGIDNPFAKESATVQESTVVEDEEEEEKVVVKQNEYMNEEYGVKFKYPTDWVIVSEQADNDSLLVRIGEKKIDPNFVFEYYLPSGSGPTICLYPDSTDMTNEMFGTKFDNFTSIKEGVLRRSYVEESDSYKICLKGETDYTDWINPGYVTYKVNMELQNSKEMLSVLDDILLSFEYTGDTEF